MNLGLMNNLGEIKMRSLSLIMIFMAFLLAACGAPVPNQAQIWYDANVKRAIDSGQPLLITYLGPRGANYVGGVDVDIYAVNTSNKTIKYLTFDVTPYNAVGDVQRGEIRRISTMHLESTGPYVGISSNPNRNAIMMTWENAWYNHTIRCVVVRNVKIEYVDGSRRNYSGPSSVLGIMGSGMNNSCRVN